jgi:acyl-[acyl-carrier-protein]-phospholipid O-acyltransferase/long-chain-fatty-acid--[acyl-carrier-protein] ligase
MHSFFQFIGKFSPRFAKRLAKAYISIAVNLKFKPRHRGVGHLVSLPGPILLVVNRTSSVDAVILGTLVERPLTILLDRKAPDNDWLKILGMFHQILRVDYEKPLGPAGLDDALKAGRIVAIFPEVAPTVTLSIMKVYQEAAAAVLASDCPTAFVSIDGPQYSSFGEVRKEQVNLPKHPVTRVFVHQPKRIAPTPDAGESRVGLRLRQARVLYDMMLQTRYSACDEQFNQNLWHALLDAQKVWGSDKIVLEDVSRKPLTYGELIALSRTYAAKFKNLSAKGENVGLLLPNTALICIAMFALWSIGRVPVLLNYSQGPTLLKISFVTAQIKTILTSQAFLTESGLGKALEGSTIPLVPIDNYKFTSSDLAKAKNAPKEELPDPNSPAVILFTSGSEGLPKGVVHSHKSMLSNNYQLAVKQGFTGDDILFNAMPLFHAMGLNPIFLMPVLLGQRSFIYLSPLHASTIPKLVYDTKCTFLAASDVFANAWARETHQADLQHVRFLFCGSERIKLKTHELYLREFGVRILEAYGVTEAAPVLASNSYHDFRLGTIGQLNPGIEHKLEPVEGVDAGGVLLVKGDNIMLGYILPEKPGVLVPLPGGWHNTGDIVDIDSEGFVWIRGRAKRFAKIAGEMVSLAAVEELLNQLWPGKPQAVIALDDEKRGEKLILVTEDEAPDLARIRIAAKEAGLPDFYCPKQFIRLETIPRYPVGKINMPKLVEEVKAIVAKNGEK